MLVLPPASTMEAMMTVHWVIHLRLQCEVGAADVCSVLRPEDRQCRRIGIGGGIEGDNQIGGGRVAGQVGGMKSDEIVAIGRQGYIEALEVIRRERQSNWCRKIGRSHRRFDWSKRHRRC